MQLFFLLQEVEPCLGFGLTGLEALSAGIPILVSLKLGFGDCFDENTIRFALCH